MSDDLPQGWAEITLQDAGAWRSGGTPSRQRKEFFGKGIPWVKSGDLPDGPILKTQEEITKLGLENSAAKLMPTGTISMALYGATIGKLGLMTFPAATNQACANVVPDTRLVEPQFLFNYLFSERRNFIEQGQGGAQPNISQEIVRSHPFPLAPLAEQRRIVAKLEKLLGQVDACQQRLEKLPTLLKRFRQSILAAACSGRLTADWREENPAQETAPTDDNANAFAELPETWQWRKIGNVFKVETGTTPPKKDPANYSRTPSDCPFFKPSDLDVGAEVRVAREWLSAQGEDHSRLLPAMTVCVTSIGATIGKTGLLRVRGATNQQINSILPTEGVQPEFTYFYCCSQYFQRRILEESSSTTLPIINKGRFVELEFPLPPLAEQQEIVRRVAGLFALADQLELRLAQARKQVDQLTPSLLARAFAGKLVPQDPADEPAAALLERIQSSRKVKA